MSQADILERFRLLLAAAVAAAAVGSAAVAEPALFESRQLTPAGEYTFGIEGPAVDASGTLYVVNHQKQGTIGRLTPGAVKSEPFAVLPPGSIGVAIRFDRAGRMYVADYKNHNVFVFERGQTEPRVYFHSDKFNQPNDLTVAADGTIYASDPSWKRRDGQVWRLTRGPDGNGRGEVMSSARKMGTTNGIDLSPDGKTLYVDESETREIWAYRVEGALLVAPRLVKKFSDFSLDGLRTDIDGRIFVARILKGTVALLSPDGTVEREIPLQAKEPTNLAFGGPDGRTIFVTQRQGGFIETFRVDRPGREYCLTRAESSDPSCRARSPAAIK
jgi:sugar lactone lactonase YvrE